MPRVERQTRARAAAVNASVRPRKRDAEFLWLDSAAYRDVQDVVRIRAGRRCKLSERGRFELTYKATRDIDPTHVRKRATQLAGAPGRARKRTGTWPIGRRILVRVLCVTGATVILFPRLGRALRAGAGCHPRATRAPERRHRERDDQHRDNQAQHSRDVEALGWAKERKHAKAA
jgi:hypothetical protein